MSSSPEADVQKFSAQLATDPNSRAFAQLSDAYRRLGQYDEAISVAREGFAKHPTYVSGRVALARALFENGDLAEAEEQLRWVTQFAPDNVLAARLLGEIERVRPPSVIPTAPIETPSPPPSEAMKAGEIKTATLAELYRSQGHFEEAKQVYADLGRPEKAEEMDRLMEASAPAKKPSKKEEIILQAMLERIQTRKRRVV